MYATPQHKTSRMGKILKSEILVLCDSVQYYNTIIFDRDMAI
jgi:hypothetical protein